MRLLLECATHAHTSHPPLVLVLECATSLSYTATPSLTHTQTRVYPRVPLGRSPVASGRHQRHASGLAVGRRGRVRLSKVAPLRLLPLRTLPELRVS